MGSIGFSSLVIFSLIILISCDSAAAGVVFNEFYYDHPGADTGHEFIELHNGQIGASNNPGPGASFWFSLPL